MIKLLKSGNINSGLLCKIAAHDKFRQLMVGIEIYVDRIASMQINNLNAMLNVVRTEILSRYYPSKDDSYMRILEVSCVHEDEYFSHTVHDDIDAIMHDIRESHMKDFNMASEVTIAEELKRQMDDVVNFKGSNQEKKSDFFNQPSIPYKKLATEEFVVLIGILKKSSYIKDKSSHRGKASLHRKAGASNLVKRRY